ncbi:hypothetical protein C8F01DRAFT_1371012 [Mycena amicta]|nr:hypothetical protein C8F01DRAFT_1371012 [Mycena amicta]
MGQYWTLVNFDKRRGQSGGKLGEMLFNRPGDSLNFFLRKIGLRSLEHTVQDYTPGLLVGTRRRANPLRLAQRACHRGSLFGLTDFPTELIDEVFGYIDNIFDMLVLSMTCQLVWSIGRRHIYAAMTRNVSSYSWAGDRLMVVGDYLHNDDIPEGLLTAEERSELLDRSPEYEDHEPSLYNYPYEEIFNWSLWFQGGTSRMDLENHLGERLQWSGDWQLFKELVKHNPTTVPSFQEFTVLRNLTKCEYVLEEKLFQLRLREDYTHLKTRHRLLDVTLGDLIYYRICWSSDPSVSVAYTGGIHQGVWAGDRFDIVSEEWLKELDTSEGEHWVDVSNEALDEIMDIWTASLST